MKGRSYKRWEDTGLYVDTYELIKAVHSVIYDFPKKDRVLASINCYTGMAKKKNNYKQLMEYKELGLKLFGKFMTWNEKKQCFNLLPKYSFKNVLKRQYKLTI